MRKSSLRRPLFLLSNVSASPWISYPAIIILQTKVMLGVWSFRDLTPGDTSSYYSNALSLLDQGTVDLVWSPIYTLVLAGLHKVFGEPFVVLTILRIAIAICTSILVLALMRRLLPKYIAWLIAAWWAILPINFDTVYTVHSFSALFPLATFVVAARCSNIYGRGMVLAGLLLTSVLVRNEYILLFLVWSPALFFFEFHKYRNKMKTSPSVFVLAYGLPTAIVVLITWLFYINAAPQFPEMRADIDSKHTLNVCQIYAYNRVQQEDAWVGNPWTECQELIERDFGRAKVTFSQAFLINPRAILGHLWWNLKLIPGGTQLALFNSYWGGPNPDYMRAEKSPWVWVPFLVIVGLCVFAVFFSFSRKLLTKENIEKNWLVCSLLISSSFLVVVIMLMQRPRPSYMFPYTLTIMALSGIGIYWLLKNLRLHNVLMNFTPLAALSLILLSKPVYGIAYVNQFGHRGQSLRGIYDRIAAHIEHPSTLIVPPNGDYTSLCNYLGGVCRTQMGEDNSYYSRRAVQALGTTEFPGEEQYVVYIDDMLWRFTPAPQRGEGELGGYVELNCSSLRDNVVTCRDGTIDLTRGVMSDGSVNMPLRAVLFVENGGVVDEKNYPATDGYYLQVLLKDNKVDRILVADERLFRTNFNQQYLLGNYDRRYFEEVLNDFPAARVLRVRRGGER